MAVYTEENHTPYIYCGYKLNGQWTTDVKKYKMAYEMVGKMKVLKHGQKGELVS